MGTYRLLRRVADKHGQRSSDRRLSAGRVRSLWGTTPILTLPLKARADQHIGVDSTSLVFTTYFITQNFDINLQRWLGVVRRFAPALTPSFDHLLLAWAIYRYDVFHYFFDCGLMQPTSRFGVKIQELEFLQRAGKRVYLYAYGADVRRREATLLLGKWNFCKECPEPGKFCVCDDNSGSRQMQEMCSKATAAIALGDMLTYVPNARNMHYWPIDLDAVPYAPPLCIDGPLKIAHAPNHTHFKGSHYLEAAIENLRSEGHAIDYVKIQGVANSEVIRLFGEADVIADQFIGGAYGYTALEAMARGKPVLTYVRSPDLVEAVDECPLISATPDTLEQVLRWMLENRHALPAIGAQGRAYVERWHSIAAVSSRLAQLYLETASFPSHINDNLNARRKLEALRRESIHSATGWHHPWQISASHLNSGVVGA